MALLKLTLADHGVKNENRTLYVFPEHITAIWQYRFDIDKAVIIVDGQTFCVEDTVSEIMHSLGYNHVG